MRILSIFNQYRHYGGEEAMMERINSLLSKHCDAHSFTYSTKELLGHSLAGKFTAPFKSLHNTEVAGKLKRMQEEQKFDAWLVHNVFPALSPIVFSTAYKLGVPVIFMVHNYRVGCINGFFLRDGHPCFLCPNKGRFQGIKYRCWHNSIALSAYNTLFQLITIKNGFLKKTAAFIAVSNAQSSYLQKMGIPANKTTVIPHFIDIPDSFSPPQKEGDILFMGRLSKEKGAHLLIEAWKDIPHHGRTLLIAGTGPEENVLRQYVSDNHIQDIEFTGFVSGRDQEKIWMRSSIYVMPSIWPETAAMTILEGWGRARPAIAFDIGAASDYLKDGRFGWLVDGYEAENLANILQKAMNMPESSLQAMGKAAREHAIANYSPSVWFERFSTLCNSIIH